MIELHVIGSSMVPTDPKHELDAHNIKIIKHCKLLIEMGYTVHFYGQNGCQEYVAHTYYHPVISLNEYKEVKELSDNFTNAEYLMVGSNRFDNAKNRIQNIFYENTRNLLEQNYKTGDFVLHFFQCFVFHNMINVRMSHGGGHWKIYKYISFETMAHMQMQMEIMDGSPKVSEVIHPWFDPNEFMYDPYNKYTIPTYLYLGRCHMYKGINRFLEFSKQYLEYNFIIAGGTLEYDSETGMMNIGHIEGTEDNYVDLTIYPNVIYIGPVYGKAKRELLSRVTALIQPTNYFEPCGWNVLEAMISGTPVLTPRIGGFVDTVVDGVTGYLNGSYKEWICNIEKVRNLKPLDCLLHVVTNFNKNKATKSIQLFFDKVKNSYIN